MNPFEQYENDVPQEEAVSAGVPEEQIPAAPVSEADQPAPAAADTGIPAAPERPAEPEWEPSAPIRPGFGARKESPYADSPYMTGNRVQNANPYTYQPQYQPKPRKEKKPKAPGSGSGFWKKAVAALLVAALVCGGCLTTALVVNRQWETRLNKEVSGLNTQIEGLRKQVDGLSRGTAEAPQQGSSLSAGGLMTPGQVYAQNVDSVVGISCTIRSTAYGRITEGTATGSGFILTENGYVATNYHVIDGAVDVKVITYGGEEYPAKVVGHDATNDVAVLKVEAEGLPAVAIGSSDGLVIGDMVVAIGNPLGELTATQTVGYVSGKNREVTTDNSIISMIQTDAAINAGNSGGPLFNMKGEVVGITTAKYSGTTNSGASIEGIGFAIPIDDVLKIIEDLQNLGYVTGAYLGVSVQNVDADQAAMFGLPTGAYVASVVEDGSADRAGLQVKDLIIGIGDEVVSNVTELTRALRRYQAGDTTTLKVIRGGQTLELSITLDERPQNLNTPDAQEAQEPQDGQTMPQQPQQGSMDEWFEYFRRFFGN